MVLDTNPVFWRCWEQLGHAVVLQACRDYANARRMLEKHPNPDSAHFNPLVDIGYYEKFFRSKYFCYICPKFDGHELFNRLKSGGWRHIPKSHHHYTKHAVYSVKTDYYKRRRLKRGGQHGLEQSAEAADEQVRAWRRRNEKASE